MQKLNGLNNSIELDVDSEFPTTIYLNDQKVEFWFDKTRSTKKYIHFVIKADRNIKIETSKTRRLKSLIQNMEGNNVGNQI